MIDLLFRTDFLGHLVKFNIIWSAYAIVIVALVHLFIKEIRSRYNYLWIIYVSVLPLSLISYYFDIFSIPFPHLSNTVYYFDPTISMNESIDYIQITIYGSILLAFIIYLARMHRFIRINKSVVLEFEFDSELKHYLKGLNIRISKLDCSPYVFGVFNPVIVISEKILKQLSSSELEVILLHEKQHIIQQDYLRNAVQKCIRALFYYNPISLALDRYLDDLRESACDIDVISIKGRSKEYAQTLYLINEMVQQKVGGLATVPFIRKTSQLKRRILRMRNVQKNDNKISRLVITTLITASTIFIACSDTAGLEEKEREIPLTVVEQKKSELAEIEKSELSKKDKNTFYFGEEKEVVVDFHPDSKEMEKSKAEIEVILNRVESEKRDFTFDEKAKLTELKKSVYVGKIKPRVPFDKSKLSDSDIHKMGELKTAGKVKELKHFIETKAATKNSDKKGNYYFRVDKSSKILEKAANEKHKFRIKQEKDAKKNKMLKRIKEKPAN